MSKQSEEATLTPNQEEYYAFYPLGLIPGFVITASLVRRAAEAEQNRAEKKNKPPKPPRRPNARIGRVALGLS